MFYSILKDILLISSLDAGGKQTLKLKNKLKFHHGQMSQCWICKSALSGLWAEDSLHSPEVSPPWIWTHPPGISDLWTHFLKQGGLGNKSPYKPAREKKNMSVSRRNSEHQGSVSMHVHVGKLGVYMLYSYNEDVFDASIHVSVVFANQAHFLATTS